MIFPLLLLLISSYGFHSFGEIGYEDIILDGAYNNYTISYLLPENATQGPEDWYLIRLNFTIELQGRGLSYFSADTNGYTSAQIKFEVQNESVTWSWANLTEFRKEKTNSKNISMFFSNYLRYRGVKPGLNNLTIRLEQYGDVKIRRVIVYGDSSGIEYTNLSPAKLELYASLPEKIKRGEKFTVRVSLKNIGDTQIKNVSISARASDNLRITGESRLKVLELGKDTNTNITFDLEALREGEYNIFIRASAKGSLNSPSALIEGKISENLGSRTSLVIISMISLIVIFLISMYYKSHQRRK